jgi:hypothetical protein
MKKFFCVVSFFFATLVLTSCGSSKQNVENPYGTEMTLTESEAYAMQKPGKRAIGKGVSYDESAARQLAELDARATFSRALDDAIVSAAKKRNIHLDMYSGDVAEGQSVTDAGGDANTFARSISSNIISNCSIVKMNKFFSKNRQYTVFLCLEYLGEIADIAKEAANQVKQRISDSDRAKLGDSLDDFENDIQNNLVNNMKKP